MKDINNCCNKSFCFKPEYHLCKFDKQFQKVFVDYIRDNECYDIYIPDDIHFFNADFKPEDTCKLLQHFQTPLTRCLYSNKFLCDSITGYFKWEDEKKFLLIFLVANIANSNFGNSNLGNSIYSFVSSRINSVNLDFIPTYCSRISNTVSEISIFNVNRIFSLIPVLFSS
ncbi:hypothetical protein RCL_jg22645.t1 [Rhizophagus clarus]|nr:hypothetical protein RCL_jg22645.t1 [Rhizophagus clarus]